MFLNLYKTATISCHKFVVINNIIIIINKTRVQKFFPHCHFLLSSFIIFYLGKGQEKNGKYSNVKCRLLQLHWFKMHHWQHHHHSKYCTSFRRQVLFASAKLIREGFFFFFFSPIKLFYFIKTMNWKNYEKQPEAASFLL